MAKATLSQAQELIAQMAGGRITKKHVQCFLENPDCVFGTSVSLEPKPMKAAVKKEKSVPMGDTAQLASWSKLLSEEFGFTIDVSAVHLPATRDDFGWLVPGLPTSVVTTQQVFEACGRHFQVWKWDDASLDDLLVKEDEESVDTATTRFIRVRDGVEADKEHRSKSANTLKDEGVVTMSLKQRLLLELWYFRETGEHLDLKSITLCAASRSVDGSVPHVGWVSGARELYVYWYRVDSRDDVLGCRQVVS